MRLQGVPCAIVFLIRHVQYSPLGNLMGYIAKMRGASFYRYGGENDWYIKKVQEKLGEEIAGQPLVLVR